MKNKKNGKTRSNLVPLNYAAYVLGVPKEIFPKLVAEIGCDVVYDEWEAPCILISDLIGLHDNPLVIAETITAFRNEAKRRQEDSASGADNKFLRDIQTKLADYQVDIGVLENIHAKYLPRFQSIFECKPLTAAYLLYVRVINLLNMGCAALEAGYWNAGIILRQIDETVDLAEYFSCSEPTPELQCDVLRWFRENRTPRPSNVRKAIAAFNLKGPNIKEDNRYSYVMNELYDKKSKFVHPAFLPIRETLRTNHMADAVAVTGFDYGQCSYPRKLYGLTLFYRSSVWTAAQGFEFCFKRQIPLDLEDAKCLHEMNSKFENEPDGL